MKKLYNVRLLLLAFLVLSLGFITSCDDDKEDNGPSQVELLSFGPTGVQHGEEIRFIGHNLNKVDAIELPSVTVNKADFVSQTAELIVLVVPQEATEGLVTLKTPMGDVVSKTVLSFEVPITITSMTEEARPGANITITGTKLNWVEGVVFESDTVDTFVSQTATQLVLQVPMTAKTGKLLVIGGGTEPAFVETEEELIVTLPEVTALTPTAVNNGANLTIKGTNLDLVKAVMFSGVGDATVTAFVSQTPTEMVVTVPANAKTGNLTLVALSDVEVETTQSLDVTLPAVTAVSPSNIKHSENLTITGTNLNLVKEIKFKGVGEAKTATFVSQSATQIVVKVPDNASSGTMTLVAKSGVEVATTQAVSIILPAITSVSPAPIDPGQNLTINGTNLDLVKSIEFKGGTKVAAFVSQSATQIVVKVPMNATKGALTLTTVKDYVVVTEAQVTIVLPIIKTVTPEPVVPGNFLTLTGTELQLVKSVVFTGGATVSTFVAQNSNQIVLRVPEDAKSGLLKLITVSNFEVQSDKRAEIGSAAPNIDKYIYQDAFAEGWDKWGGWGTAVQDVANAEQVSRGSSALKISYNDAYGAVQLHPTNANVLAGYTHLVLYVYGATADGRMAIQVKNTGGTMLADVPFDIKKGEYKLIEIPITSLGDVSGGISELYIKNYGTNPNTVYVDDFGLR
ncbi:IPT/TIG domain-containing protein [Pontibacter sp. E15-1]|uniref:IPT/TIG domain-containing protein n=1 Tax=Pontibacter sp. E15-1 TaxID=2919918 RepID=UPI001F4FC6D8|nr:IPT/TIG domain-containing protein [Pontibacter sp. E15-1]MCJ8165876.1 IPT/TIG domain-containing protein [Pontibacter sp. E15-1]